MTYEYQHSVEAAVSRKDAWRFWTNVDNWKLDSDIEWVRLEGPFQAGSRGTTKSKTSSLVQWKIAEAIPGESAVIKISTPGAEARFAWKFEQLAEEKTRLTQQITFSGEQAHELARAMGDKFEQGIGQGMEKLAKAMERSAVETSASGSAVSK